MALTFFWRCEATTLDGTDDFSAGDTTATANNTPAISATGARIGTNGLVFDAVSERYDFNPASIWNRLTGSAAFSFQFPSAIPSAGQIFLFIRANASANDNISVEIGASQELTLRIRNSTGTNVTLTTTAVNLTAGNWYSVVIRWDQPNNDRSISVYNSSDVLIETVSDTTTAYDAPTALDATNGFRLGDSSGSIGTLYIDNVFVADSYSEPLENNLSITSYTSYNSGGAAAPKRMLLLGVG